MDGQLGISGDVGGGFEDGPDFDAMAAATASLRDHLLTQAGMSMEARDLLIASHLIDQIDDAGYLSMSLLELANRLGAPLLQVENVLDIIQTFDPTGVGARSLGECLSLQAKEADRYDPAMARLLDNLDLLAEGSGNLHRPVC